MSIPSRPCMTPGRASWFWAASPPQNRVKKAFIMRIPGTAFGRCWRTCLAALSRRGTRKGHGSLCRAGLPCGMCCMRVKSEAPPIRPSAARCRMICRRSCPMRISMQFLQPGQRRRSFIKSTSCRVQAWKQSHCLRQARQTVRRALNSFAAHIKLF